MSTCIAEKESQATMADMALKHMIRKLCENIGKIRAE